MKELTSEQVFESLVGYGLFADKLPPCFSSESFYKASENCPLNNKPHVHATYDNIRNINIPRQLGIPNPIAYMKLCKCIADNWDKIVGHFDRCTKGNSYNVSRIHIRKMYDTKSIFKMNYDDWRNDPTPENKLLVGKKYVVHADISNCFPSIYTHSLTWALIGKEVAKKGKKGGQWYNKLDQFCRNTKDAETNGLLIGPHAYNILSEIVLCDIDRVLSIKWDYIRNIDDYSAYVKSEEEAEKFLIDLQNELKKYGLLLNHKKTKIRKLPFENEEMWLRSINSIKILTSYGKVDYKLCKSYFNFVIDLFKRENEDASVIKYAIKVLSNQELTDNAKEYEKDFTFHLSMIYPYIIPLLDAYVFKPCNVLTDEIEHLANKIYSEYMNRQIFEAVSFSLFWSIKYNFDISGFDIDAIMQSKDCVLLALSYQYCKNRFLMKKIKILKQLAKDLSKDDNEFDRNWLFVYETLDIDDFPEKYNEWKYLKKNNVSFIDFKKVRSK